MVLRRGNNAALYLGAIALFEEENRWDSKFF